MLAESPNATTCGRWDFGKLRAHAVHAHVATGPLAGQARPHNHHPKPKAAALQRLLEGGASMSKFLVRRDQTTKWG